jgi:hypothetical protein
MGRADPTAVRIDDLRHPVFPPEIDAMRGPIAELAARRRLEPDELMEAAVRKTGLYDFGPDDFREPLEVFCRAVRDEGRLNAIGTVAMTTDIGQWLRNRLHLQQLRSSHPGVADVEIDRPVFIAGLARTGTTHLQNMMSSDPQLRSLPYWESLEPVTSEAERGVEPDPRLARTEGGLTFLNLAMPHFVRMHEMTVDHAHEDCQLLAMTFCTSFLESFVPVPSYRDWFRSHDQSSGYDYLHTILQAMQWLRGGERWINKSAHNLENLPALARSFRDATFVVTHRDPVSVIASLATMITYASRMYHDTVDAVWIGQYWADRVEDFLRAVVRDRDALPTDRTVDVHFRGFMSDNIATVRRIYDVAELPFDDEARAAIEGYVAGHRRARHGSVIYELADFDLDADDLRTRFAFYYDRFGIEPESVDRR